MVNVNLKCICCGRTWSVAIDEHELPRYLSNVSKESMSRNLCCPCANQLPNIQDVNMDSVCYRCWDHTNKVKDF